MSGYGLERRALLALLALPAVGCAGTSPSRPGPAAGRTGERIATAAEGLVGAPYRYGGATPAGFDCSGLVQYAHLRAGLVVPRTTRTQRLRAAPVALTGLAPGDLLFFSLDGDKVSHVGIYAGAGRFVHAPSTGRAVSRASLRTPYWRERLAGAGRFY